MLAHKQSTSGILDVIQWYMYAFVHILDRTNTLGQQFLLTVEPLFQGIKKSSSLQVYSGWFWVLAWAYIYIYIYIYLKYAKMKGKVWESGLEAKRRMDHSLYKLNIVSPEWSSVMGCNVLSTACYRMWVPGNNLADVSITANIGWFTGAF